MKGFERKNQLFSLCGLNCGLCPMFLGKHLAVAGMVINRAELLSVALNMVKLNIVMNVKVIHVKNIGILINMILL